jgi:hypothetical protein
MTSLQPISALFAKVLFSIVCVSCLGGAPDPFANSVRMKMSAGEALDYEIARELNSLLAANQRLEFLALLAIIDAKQATRKVYEDVMSRAVAHSDSLFLLALLKSGLVDINSESEDGYSIGSCALEVPEKGDFPHRLRRLQLLFDLGYKPRAAELLVQAAVKNCPEVINEVDDRLGGRLDVNEQFLGTTPLIAAVKYGSVQCVTMLLARQADPMMKDRDGKTAINYAELNLNATGKTKDAKTKDAKGTRDDKRAIQKLLQAALSKMKPSEPK